MNIKCKNGEPHTHETLSAARQCWGHAGHTGPRTLASVPNDMDYVRADVAKINEANRLARGGHHGHVHVADGRYALWGSDGKVHFYRIKNGHKTGVVFVDEQAGDDMWPVRDRAVRRAVLAQIAADPDALARYGRELGVCGVCGRTLTDEASRAAGIGPVCATR